MSWPSKTRTTDARPGRAGAGSQAVAGEGLTRAIRERLGVATGFRAVVMHGRDHALREAPNRYTADFDLENSLASAHNTQIWRLPASPTETYLGPTQVVETTRLWSIIHDGSRASL